MKNKNIKEITDKYKYLDNGKIEIKKIKNKKTIIKVKINNEIKIIDNIFIDNTRKYIKSIFIKKNENKKNLGV